MRDIIRDDNTPLIEGMDDLESYLGEEMEFTSEDEENFFGAGLLGKVAGKLLRPKPAPAPVINVAAPAGPSAAELAVQKEAAAEQKASAEKKDKRDQIMMWVGIGAFVVTLVGLIIAAFKK